MKNSIAPLLAIEERRKTKLRVQICERAELERLSHPSNRMRLMMDLESVSNLNLEQLLEASPLDFSHDVLGIVRHMDRASFPGKLQDCFEPRCTFPCETEAI